MKSSKQFKKLISFIICALLLISQTFTVMAWKPQTHVYSSNLLLQEISQNNGYLEIPPFGKFKVPDEYLAAITEYPDYFHAGAVGPDAFPDIYVGQAFIHPNDGTTSGEWLQHLWDKANSYPSGSDDRNQIISFTLGFMIHGCGDLFGHTYINSWAKGPFPNVSDGVNQAELENIMRHTALESYIEKKIPQKYKQKEYNTITAPKYFIFQNLVVEQSLDSGLNKMYNYTSSKPKHFETFLNTRKTLKAELESIGDPSWYDIYNNAKKAYIKAWIEDIDNGLYAWLDVNEQVAQNMLIGNGAEGIKEPITDWVTNHYISMSGAPDVAGWILNAIVDVSDFISDVLGPVAEPLRMLKTSFYNEIFEQAIGISYEDLKELSTSPETYIDDDDSNYSTEEYLFAENARIQIDEEMKNFTTISDPTALEQEFEPFYNTLIMAKLVLIGPEGIDKLLSAALDKEVVCYSTPEKIDDIVVNFIESMDESNCWETTQFPLWSVDEYRTQVFNVIFKGFEQ